MSFFQEIKRERQFRRNIKKGQEFEQYIEDLFHDYEFALLHRTERYKKNQRVPESVQKPDFAFRDRKTTHEFWVECKFRSSLYKNKLQWTNPHQLRQYQMFQQQKNQPVFIVVGLGGFAWEPEEMFAIPLTEAKYPELYESVFGRFERRPDKEFTYYDGKLL